MPHSPDGNASVGSHRSHSTGGSSSLKGHAMVQRIDLAEDSRWRVHWSPHYGRYYFEDHHVGETRWDPPPSLEKSFGRLPEIRRLEKTEPAEHRAACTLQGFFKRRVVPHRYEKALALGQVGMFEKHIDEATGRFYYMNEHGETSWDAPAGTYPLEKLPKERLFGLELEKAMRAAEKREASIERATLIQIRREDYEREQREKRRQNKNVEKSHEQQVWMDAFSIAAETKELQVSWQKLGTIHPDIPRFKQRYGFPLAGLRLVGHDLEALPTDFGKGLQNLTALSLASNRLEMLPEGICRLTNLRSLNLLRNRLRLLPAKFGELLELRDLYVSSNRLESIPSSFGNLVNLGRVDLNANRLRRLPDSLQRLSCHTFVCNGNLLTSISPALCKMKHLKKMSLCENQIKYLPREIGDMARIETLHLLGNRLMELPDTLGKLTTLRELWLGMNNLTSLPWNFYQLTKLQRLSLEGCPDMVHPTHKYLSRGPAVVLDWSERRWKHAKYVRRQTICVTLQNLFEQLEEQSEYFGREIKGYFEPETEHDDQEWFALAIPQFNYVRWTINLRRLFADQKKKDEGAEESKGEEEGGGGGGDEEEAKDAAAAAAEKPATPEPAKVLTPEEQMEKKRKAKAQREKLLGWKPLFFPGGDEKLAKQPRPEDQDEAPPGGTPRKGDASDSDDDDSDDDDDDAEVERTDAEIREKKRKEAEKAKAQLEKETPVETCTIGSVIEGSSAAKAGLKAGQKIVGIAAVGIETVPVKSYKNIFATLKDLFNQGVKEVEMQAEIEGKTGFFWEYLLPKLEEYWRAGHDDPEEVDVPRKYVQNFPFERDEVDRVLRTFSDPWGPVCCTVDDVLFRRCNCIQEDGKRRVCVPPKSGYMCSRRALLFKSEVKLQRHKDEHDRKVREASQVDAMVEIAREQAVAWTKTEEGRTYVRELAAKKVNEVMDSRRKQRWEGKVDGDVAAKIRSLETAYAKKRKKLEDTRDGKEKDLRMKRQMIDDAASVEVGLARELKEKEADEIQEQIENLPEHNKINLLTEEHNKRIDELVGKSKNKDYGGGGLMGTLMKSTQALGNEYWKVLRELEVDLRDQYVKRECRKARQEKEEENRNLRKISEAWNGVGLRSCFRGWKKFTQRELNQRTRDDARGRRQRFEAIQIPKATIKIARFKVRSWGGGELGKPKPQIDLWTDKPYWTHTETGEQRWTEPTTEEYLPKDFVMPEEYVNMDDEELDLIDMDEDVGFEDVELPYPDVDEPTPREPTKEEKGLESDSDDEDSDNEEGGSKKKKNLISLDDLDPEEGEAEAEESTAVVRSRRPGDSSSDEEGGSDDDDDDGEGSKKAGGGALAIAEGSDEDATDGETEGSMTEGSMTEGSMTDDDDDDDDDNSTLQLEAGHGDEGVMIKGEKKKKRKKRKKKRKKKYELEDTELVPRPKTPMGFEVAIERTMDEATAAMVRMRARRERAVELARKRAEEAEAEAERRGTLLADERAEEDAEKERAWKEKLEGGPKPGAEVGFDPDRVYTNKELTRLAREQVEANKAKGLDADGRPLKSLDVDRTLEEYGFDPDAFHDGLKKMGNMFSGFGKKEEKKKKRRGR